jgi:hypothetical protein
MIRHEAGIETNNSPLDEYSDDLTKKTARMRRVLVSGGGHGAEGAFPGLALGMAVHRLKIASSEAIFLLTLARGPTHEPQLRDHHSHTSPSLAACWWHIHFARNSCSRGWAHYMNTGIAMSSLSALSCAHPCWRMCNDHYGLCSPSHISCCREAPSLRTPHCCYSLA